LELMRVLRDPSDSAARQALTSLRAQRDLAEAHLRQRVVRASRAGIVSDLRAHAGERLAPGDLIASIVGDSAPVSLTAVLPGRYRPQLKPGMPLRFELDGDRYRYHDLTIESVGDDVVGPAEVRRFLGADAADTVEVKGPLVLVRARLEPRLRQGGQASRYFDGLPGRVDVKVRSESILVGLVPALRAVRHAD
ncbi:MAG TPA: HlyD family secretion protein, partial [Polyangia bacterium]